MANLTLSAALRDLESKRPEARAEALRNLAPALLEDIGLSPPCWWDRVEHDQRDAVVGALERICATGQAQDAGLALVSLAQLSAPSAHARARAASTREDEDEPEAASFMRECGVIALSLLGAAARAVLEQDEGPPAARALVDELVDELGALLEDPRPDVRFQAAPALVEVGGAAVEARLLAAFAKETHPEVRANMVAALSLLDPPGQPACDALAALLETEEAQGEIGWEAAMVLAAARRPEAAPRLLEGLRSQATRDRALEAIAALGPAAPARAAELVRRYTTGLRTPVFTRVRAAYALARLDPEAGEALLDRLAKHIRPSVREAVAEARQLLAPQLEGPAKNPGDGS